MRKYYRLLARSWSTKNPSRTVFCPVTNNDAPDEAIQITAPAVPRVGRSYVALTDTGFSRWGRAAV